MSSVRRVLLIIALTAMWSPSFLFIKLAVEELPPFTIVTLRVGLATAILGLILLWKKRSLPVDFAFWFHSAIMALFASVLPFALFCYAEKTIESALAALLNGCSPLFTALLAHTFIPSDKLQPNKVLGIGLGAAGLLLLFAPNLQQGVSGTTLGILAGATAAFCYALSHVYAKKYVAGNVPFVAPMAQLLCSTLMMAPFMLFYDAPWDLPFPSSSALLGVFGLTIFGTLLAFIIYYKLIEHCGPTAISMVACFFPVGGMVLGFVFLGETLTWGGMGASLLILMGLMIVNNMIDVQKARSFFVGIFERA
jgi:drug/metabolite transporter (DMT)-like permease